LILVIGLAVGATGFTPDRAAAVAVSIATTVLFWRIYIYHAAELLPSAIATAPEPDRIARSALVAHLLMVAGIVATAVGSQLVIDHPLGHTQPAWIAVTLGGPALFLAGRTILEHQVSTRMSWDRPIGIFVLAALTPAMLHVVPLLVALTATAVLTGNAIADTASTRGRQPNRRHH
jgi:low temperature requirement protein LtrA